MAVTLYAPRYSFVQITEPEPVPECVDVPTLCLPIVDENDLKFQLYADVSGDDKDWFSQIVGEGEAGTLHEVRAGFCAYCTDTGLTDPPGQPIHTTVVWRKITEGSTDTWVGNFTLTSVSGLEKHICYRLCFYEFYAGFTGNITRYLTCSSTCFNLIDDDCFTSVLNYGCRENSFDFIYLDANDDINWANKVRLPCFLRDAQFQVEEKSYRKSDGDRIKLNGRLEEDYQLVVDWVFKSWHKRMVVLLQHDLVDITNDNDSPEVRMPIVNTEGYEITWPEDPYATAMATTRVKRANGVNLVNSNCQ